MQRERARVARIVWQDAALQIVELEGRDPQALNYVGLSGACAIGDDVLLNATATSLHLGTGGFDFVIANFSHPESQDGDDRNIDWEEPQQQDAHGFGATPSPDAGRMMKLRYTPMQLNVATIEEQGSPFHEAMRNATSLDGLPVVCCELHSQFVLAAAGIRRVAPNARIVYCMTDEAALALPMSRIARQARDTGLVDFALTCGQAFGGDAEAITLHSALLAARHALDADIAVVAQGPGIAGTGTPFGHGGVAQAQAINAVAALGGQPTAALRLSFADERPRHHGVSHHALGALGTLALARARVVLPGNLAPEQRRLVTRQLDQAQVTAHHEVATVELKDMKPADVELRGLDVTTMGRHFEEDPAFFWAAFAAGIAAAGDIAQPAASTGRQGTADNPLPQQPAKREPR